MFNLGILSVKRASAKTWWVVLAPIGVDVWVRFGKWGRKPGKLGFMVPVA